VDIVTKINSPKSVVVRQIDFISQLYNGGIGDNLPDVLDLAKNKKIDIVPLIDLWLTFHSYQNYITVVQYVEHAYNINMETTYPPFTREEFDARLVSFAWYQSHIQDVVRELSYVPAIEVGEFNIKRILYEFEFSIPVASDIMSLFNNLRADAVFPVISLNQYYKVYDKIGDQITSVDTADFDTTQSLDETIVVRMKMSEETRFIDIHITQNSEDGVDVAREGNFTATVLLHNTEADNIQVIHGFISQFGDISKQKYDKYTGSFILPNAEMNLHVLSDVISSNVSLHYFASTSDIVNP
jgi:hypothetical protein